MKKEIREVDKKNGIVQITTFDERWYARPKNSKKTGLPEYEFVPSITWIASFYPKGIGFYKWLAQKGWDEAEAIKTAAGDKGSKVHQAILDLIDQKEVRMDAKYLNKTIEKEEELTTEEWECLKAFRDWYQKTKPKVIMRENTLFNDHQGFAGTLDLVCVIDGEHWIIDFKTGQMVWPEHSIQLAGYKYLLENSDDTLGQGFSKVKTAILQLGYRRNQAGYKFTEIETRWELFLAAREIWKNETTGEKPSQKDYPIALTLQEENPKKKK